MSILGRGITLVQKVGVLIRKENEAPLGLRDEREENGEVSLPSDLGSVHSLQMTANSSPFHPEKWGYNTPVQKVGVPVPLEYLCKLRL